MLSGVTEKLGGENNFFFFLYVCFFFLDSESEGSENWEVVDDKSSKADSRYYLNVCHKVIPTGRAAGCPVDAAMCAVGKNVHKEGVLKD